MSYRKVMKHAGNVRKCRAQSKMHFGFSSLANDERRRLPWLGGHWFQPGRDEERAQFIADYQAETERLLKINPNLKIVD